MQEQWKVFYRSPSGIEYAVSNYGRIKNITWTRIKKPQLCRHQNRKYRWAVFRTKDVCRNISRIVAENFVPNPDNKPWVDHIDRNPLNNRADNLRWVTQRENQNNITTIKGILLKLSEHFSITQIADYTGLTVAQVGAYLDDEATLKDALEIES